jgi:hypothetical protein
MGETKSFRECSLTSHRLSLPNKITKMIKKIFGAPSGQKITLENSFSVFKLDKNGINIFFQLKTARA